MPRTIHSLAGAILAALSSTPALAATAHLSVQLEQKPFAAITTASDNVDIYTIELKLDSALQQGQVDKAQHQAIKKCPLSSCCAVGKRRQKLYKAIS